MAQEIKNDDATAWALVVVRNSSGIGVTGLTASDFSSVNVQRDNLAASSLTLTDASGPTDHGAGKLLEVDAGVYKVGIASALLTGFVGNLSITGTYASGAVVPVPNNVVEPERGTDGANTTTPNTTTPLDAAGIRTALGMASADLDSQLDALPADIEAAMVNDGDATALLQAIADKIASDLTVGDITTQAIVSAIKADATLAQMIARIDADVSSRSSHSAPTLPTNFASLLINADGHIERVSLVDANTDMRGTDGANTVTPLDAAGVRTAVGLTSANLDGQLSAIPTTAPLDAAGTRAALGMSAANLDTQLSTIDTEVGQVLDRAGYSLTILAGALSNAGSPAEQYEMTIDGTAHRVTYAALDSNGNRGTTVLSKP